MEKKILTKYLFYSFYSKVILRHHIAPFFCYKYQFIYFIYLFFIFVLE